jgi:hypothetical protein
MAFIHCKICRKSESIQPIRQAYVVPGVCTRCRKELQGFTRQTLSLAQSLERFVIRARTQRLVQKKRAVA